MFCEIRARLQVAIDAGVDFDTAMTSVESEVLSSAAMAKAVIREAISIASRYVTRAAVSSQRKTIFEAAARIACDRAQGTEKLKEDVARLMMFRLPGGKPIAESTGTECLDAAAFYRQLARTNRMRADWLESVGRRAGDAAVKDRLSESDLQSIYESLDVSYDK